MAKMNRWNDILGSISKGLKGSRRKKKEDFNPFDIFPDWFKGVFTKNADKDKKTVEEKDYTTGVETYLARKKAHKKRTSPGFDDSQYTIKQTKFSSPPDTQEIAAPTNMGGYTDDELNGIEYNDPVISTKPTPTSIKMGVSRPGPSTFIQTAKYNPQTKRLNVQYTDGTIFPYNNVSMELADRILKKKAYHSPGQEMLNTIFYGHGTTRADQISDINEGM